MFDDYMWTRPTRPSRPTEPPSTLPVTREQFSEQKTRTEIQRQIRRNATISVASFIAAIILLIIS